MTRLPFESGVNVTFVSENVSAWTCRVLAGDVGAAAEEYFRGLNAPANEWIWFDHSGQSTWVSEAQEFAQVVADRFLNRP
jgi:hypothetical protein